MIESFNPFANRQDSPDDLWVEFDYGERHIARWVGKMSRADAIVQVMRAENIDPTKRRDLLRVTIRTRKEIAKWKPQNQKPAW